MLELLKEARAYFNSRAEQLVLLVKPYIERGRRGEPPKSSLDHQPFETLGKEDIISIADFGFVDGFGRHTARFFLHNGQRVGLNGEDYMTFDTLTGDLARRQEVRSLLSRAFVEDTVFDWLRARVTAELSIQINMVDHLISRATEAIRAVKISVPIAYLAIERPFAVGRVEFEYFTREFFDAMFTDAQALAEKHPSYDEVKFGMGMQRLRSQYQGTVFASLTVCAEEQRAVEVGFEETDKALMVLRFFSPGAFVPDIPSYFARMGQSDVPRSHVFIFRDKYPSISESIDESRSFIWTVTTKDIERLEAIGLQQASALITETFATELAEALLNSIAFFTKGIATNDPQEKLVFTLVALETLLLKDSSEPLQINIGQRLAFLVEQTAAKRKEVLSCVREAYGLRSSYLHHGVKESEINLLRHLLIYAWTAFRNVLMSLDKFVTRKQLLDHLEGQILS